MALIQQKVHFWIARIKTFRLIFNLFGFEEVRILPLFFRNNFHYDVICNHWDFKSAYFVHNISYQSCKFQSSRWSGSNFTKGVGPSRALPRPKILSAFKVRTSAWTNIGPQNNTDLSAPDLHSQPFAPRNFIETCYLV